jgi:hypothetical protein
MVGQAVDLDDVHFVDCDLQRCTLRYGGGPVIFERTSLIGCRYLFFGSAKASIEFLQSTGLLSRDETKWREYANPSAGMVQ